MQDKLLCSIRVIRDSLEMLIKFSMGVPEWHSLLFRTFPNTQR